MTSHKASMAPDQYKDQSGTIEAGAGFFSARLGKRRSVESSHPPVQCELTSVRWRLSANGRVWGDMPAWRTFTGQPRAAMQGSGWFDAVHSDERDRVRAACVRAIAAQLPYATVCRILRDDGSYNAVSLHLLPMLDAQGHLHGWDCTGVILAKQGEYQAQPNDHLVRAQQSYWTKKYSRMLQREHTASAAAESAVARSQASERRFQRLVEANIIGIVISDGDRVLDANDMFLHMLGYTREEMVAGQLTKDELLTPASASARAHAVKEALITGASQPAEREYVRRDGSRLPALVGMALLERDPALFVSFVLDLSERKCLEHEREEARARELAQRQVNQRMDTFFATAAHDLRNPVAVCLMEVQHAQRRVLKASQIGQPARVEAKQIVPFIEVGSALEATERQLGGLWRLLQQLLDVTYAREGRLVLNRQPCDLAILVRQAIGEQRLLSPTRTLTLDLPNADPTNANVAGQLVQVEADAIRLGQALTNLLTNAVRYSPEDQPVQVRLRHLASEGVARVEVQDFGGGIPAREQGMIWERFQQAQNVRETSGGLGLGLHIARMIVELHNGCVGVESAEGQGSTFWFTLPLALTRE